MKKLLTLLLFISSFTYSHAQKKLTITDGLRIGVVTVDSISRDTALGGLDNVLPTQKAVRDYYLNRSFRPYIMTVAALRASTNTPTNVIVTTIDNGGGTWNYIGLSDGQYVDDGGRYVITADNHTWKRQDTDGKIHLSWFGTGTNANLTKALVYDNTIVIDQLLNISTSTITIPQGKIIEVAKGGMVTTSSGGKLVIAGQLIAGAYQIFDTAANVKIRPYSVTEIYPEWFGASPLINPRQPGLTVGSASDVTAAFKKTVSIIEGGEYPSKAFSAIIRLRGMYGISDQIDVHGGYKLIGTGPEMQGTGFRWLGPGNPAKSMILFLEAEYGGAENLVFIGSGSTSSANRLRSAIEMTWNGTVDTERGMTYSRLMFGNVLGYYAGIGNSGYDFDRAIFCSGSSGNNDFHTLTDIQVADTRIGIETETDQSVEWHIDNYRMNWGETMYKSGLGGSVIGNRWYTHGTGNGDHSIIEVLGSISHELRMSLQNFSSEYMHATAFIKSDAVVKFNLQGENFISVNANSLDSTDGFGLITGAAANFGQFSFTNTRFEFNDDGTARSVGYVNTRPRMFIDQPATGNILTKIVNFHNCTGARYLYMKFPSTAGAGLNYTHLTFDGERMGEPSIDTNWYQSDRKIAVNEFHPKIKSANGSRWLQLGELFDGETEIVAKTIAYGEKGRTTLSTMDVKGYRTNTINSIINAVPKILPAKSIIKGVSVMLFTSNILPDFLHYVKVGTVRNESLFGILPVPNGFSKNTVTATTYVTDTAEPLIFKGYVRYQDHFIYTISGTTLSVGYTAFEPGMVGGIFRYLSGANINKEFLITGYTSPNSVTIANPYSISDATGGMGEIQTPLAADKEISITVTSESIDKYSESLNYGLQSGLPVIPSVARTPIVNEKQWLFTGVDTTGFGGSSGGGGSAFIATSTIAGIVKVGANMDIDGGGAITFHEGNVVHKSDPENIYGTKTFDDLRTYNGGAAGTGGITVENINEAGAGLITLKNNTGSAGQLFYMGSAYGGYGALTANDIALYTSATSGDIDLISESGSVKIAASGNTPKLTVTGTDVTATVPVTIPAGTLSGHAVNLSQLGNYLTTSTAATTYATQTSVNSSLNAKVGVADTASMLNPYARKADSTSIYTGTYLKGTGTAANPLDVDTAKLQRTGAVTFTGDASTTSFTFISSISGLSADSKIFITARTAIGAAIDHVDVSTESFTVYFTAAPSTGSKTLNYLIIP